MKTIAMVTVAVVLGTVSASAQDREIPSPALMTIYGVDSVEPHYSFTRSDKCQALVDAMATETLFVEDDDLPRQKVKSIECRCVKFDETEASQ